VKLATQVGKLETKETILLNEETIFPEVFVFLTEHLKKEMLAVIRKKDRQT